MNDYISMGTDLSNEIAMSMQPGKENEVEFSDACNASGRFLHLAKIASDKGFLGWQISTDNEGELSSFVFTSPGVIASAEDYNWIFKKCAVSEPNCVTFLKNLYEENRKVYVLSYKSESTKYYEVSENKDYGYYDEDYSPSPDDHFAEMIEMLEAAGAVIRMIADSSEETKDSGLVFISFPDEISLRLRGMISMALPHVEIEAVGNLPEAVKDSKHIPNDLFRTIMSNLLYALIQRSAKKADQQQGKTTEAVREESGGMTSDQNDEYTTSIDELNLSKRSYKCLMHEGFRTIGPLRNLTDADLDYVCNRKMDIIEEIKEKLAEYLQRRSDLMTIPSLQAESYYDMLDELIGLKEAKQQIRKIAAFAKMRRDIAASGGQKMSVVLNMEFIGNPGTAKTTVARISAGIFHEIGLLPSKEMIEAGRADLIGKYEGQTAGKVKDLFSKAKGKMLFIDEAYSLVEDWEGSYGDEAINTIVQEMENHREDTIVVFAGYPDKMNGFFGRNPGLRSRVPFTVRFDDYSTDEMVKIAELEAEKRGFQIEAEAMEKVREICNLSAGNSEAGNGRLCRNLVEGAVLEYALRNYDEVEEQTHRDYILRGEDFLMPDILKTKIPVNKTLIGFAV